MTSALLVHRRFWRRHFSVAALGAAALLLGAGSSARAASKTWDGGDSANSVNWTDGINWDADTAPVAGDALFFDGTLGLNNTNDYAAATSFLGITFNPGAGSFTLNGNSITSTGGIVSNSLNLETVNIPLIFTATHTLGAIAGGAMVVNGVISGAGGITKAGGGTVSLTAANTFTGTVTLNAGTLLLDFSAAGAPGTPPPATNIIASGRVLALSGGSLTVQGAAGGTNSQTLGATTLNSGLTNINVLPGAGGTASLTLASLARTNSANNANIGGGLRFGTAGTITITGTVNSAILLDGQGNPYATYGLDDWAATDATGKVIAAVPGTAYNDYTTDTAITTNITPNAVRLSNTAAPVTLTLSSTVTATLRGILMTSTSVGATITGGFIRPNRSSTAGATFELFQNSTVGDLTISSSIGNASSSTPVGLSKNGAGRVILANTAANGYTGQTFINEGTLSIPNDNQLGAGTSAVNFAGGALEIRGLADPSTPTVFPAVSVSSPRAFVFNSNSALSVAAGSTLTLTGVVSGGANFVTLSGPGTTFFANNANTYTGRTVLNGGTLNIVGINALGGGNYGGVIFNGGALQYASTLASGSDISIGGAGVLAGSGSPVTLSAGGGTIDTNGNNVSYANSIGNGGTGSLTKAGTGTLTFNAGNNYSGGTIINGGGILVNNTTGSGAGSGSVSVGAAGTLGGAGIITGSVTTVSGSTLIPGNPAANAGVGTLTLGGLTLAGGSISNFELVNGTNNNDLIAVTGTLSLTGTAGINLFQAGTANRFTSPGTYNLFSYGSFSGSVSNFSVLNQASGVNYSFSLSGGNTVQLTISSTLVTSSWNSDSNGNYGDAAKWTNNAVPEGAGTTAIFGSVITAPRTVNIEANHTVGEIDFNNANAYTLAAGGGTLTLNNGGGAAVLQDISGSHAVNAPLNLAAGVSVLVTNAADTLTIGGVIGGTGPLTKGGAGIVALTGSNTFIGGVTITNGTVQINSASSLGDISNVAALDSTSNAATLQALNSIVSGRSFTLSGINNTIQVDGAANTYEIDGIIGNGANPGSLNKTGAGALALAGSNTFTGITTITQGTLSIGAGGTSGSLTGNIVNNNAALVLNRSDDFAVANIISGTGTLTKAGAGNATLSSTNTFAGSTVVSGGTLTLGIATALQSSTLNYDNQGGALSFGALTAATLGGLSGSQGLVLLNTAATPAAVTLTVGNNNTGTTYSGSLSGTGGGLTKVGTGTLTLTGNNSYTGATNVNGGLLIIDSGGVINGGAINTSNAGGSITVNNGSVTSSAASAINTSTSFTLNTGGTAAFNGGVRINSNGSDADLLRVAGGTFTATDVNIGRNAGTTNSTASTTAGFIISGGNATVGTLEIGTNNSQATTLVSSGSLTVTGAVSISNNTTASTRPNVLQVTGGTFNSTDTSAAGGIILGVNATTAAPAVLALTGGTTNAQRISFGGASTITGSTATLSLGAAASPATLYVGSGGIVNGAATPGNITPTITLTNGTIGALADWSTTLPATIGTAVTFQTSDASAVPHTVAWGGLNAVTGTVTGGFTGAGNLTVGGGGTLVLNGSSNYTGTTTINAGTVSVNNNPGAAAPTQGTMIATTAITINAGGNLSLAGDPTVTDRLNDAANVTMAGGRLSTNGLTERSISNATGGNGLGTLTLNANSVIDLGTGASQLAFANSSALAWTGRLSIFNWSGNAASGNGVDQLYFGVDATGLSAQQLTQIQFFSDSGATALGSGAAILGTGEVVPVPEPATTALVAVLGLGALGWSLRRRLPAASRRLLRRRAA